MAEKNSNRAKHVLIHHWLVRFVHGLHFLLIFYFATAVAAQKPPRHRTTTHKLPIHSPENMALSTISKLSNVNTSAVTSTRSRYPNSCTPKRSAPARIRIAAARSSGGGLVADFEEGEPERPKWTGETALSRLVASLISFKPLYSVLKLGARQVLISTAEKANIPWRDMTKEILESDVYSVKDAIEDPSIVYPDYYLNPFHAYDEGNLSWLAAAEAEAATMSIAKRAIPSASSLDEANQIVRGNWLQVIEIHHQKYSGNSAIREILDIGCSVGVSTRFLADKFPSAKVTGLDLSPYFLAVAQYKDNKINQGTEPIRWIHGNGENTGLPSKSFDLVSIAYVFHECPERAIKNMVKEAFRLLKPGGTFAITDNSPKSKILQELSPVLFTLMKSTEPFLDEYYLTDLEGTLQQVGFVNVQSALTDPRHKTVTATPDRMEKDKKTEEKAGEEEEVEEAIELVLFHVSECYVYLIPPRKTAASYRADEWNVNKWAWEGTLKVVSKGEECIIRLEDKKTGELYARAFLRDGEPHPVEAVIDSSRYFVLRVEENIGGRLRHAFIGIGFRERTEAYDFQAALHDHMKYLNKKKTAEEMEQQFQNTSSVDYSLKDGETLVLQLKNSRKSRKHSRYQTASTSASTCTAPPTSLDRLPEFTTQGRPRQNLSHSSQPRHPPNQRERIIKIRESSSNKSSNTNNDDDL
ncbi:Adaptin ear-binding coat-associated protein 2 [Sesamum alatum]|uniref:Adaptin ear-binding coat-associated protein 2 n=1 Tax=Sesamum alatum TaxID=300844 RepID=A0AAE2CG76_9LAMI|nr:Adaptin ear-binding coat-associated protein 2 [Sesamum alatum]